MIQKLVQYFKDIGSLLRSILMVFSHGFKKRDTVQYPEEPIYVPPRYRGRIVLTRDPDGEERCVACNLCAVSCPVGCISLQKPKQRMGAGTPNFSASISRAAFFVACARKPVRRQRFSLPRILK